MEIKFGTGGWRVPLEDFTKENIYRVAIGIEQYLINHCTWCADKECLRIIIGYDNRKNSDKAAIEVFNILNRTFSVKIFDKSVTTPTVMKYVNTYDYNLGVMITASHNPANFNGIKVSTVGGRDATVEVTDEIEKYSNSLVIEEDLSDIENITKECIKNTISSFDFEKKFIKSILDTIDVKKIRSNNYNIVFDNMRGSGISLFTYLANKLDINTYILNAPGNTIDLNYVPCPTEENNKEISSIVKYSNKDFGIAFDGDGDRLGIIDENGNFIDGNDMLCLFVWYLYAYRNLNTSVAVSCCSTNRVGTIARSFGYDVVETPIGVKYLVEQILENNIDFAGEQNGGVIFPRYLWGKDSIGTLAIFLEMLAVTNKTVSELVEHIHNLYGNTCCISDQVKYVVDREKAKELIENNYPQLQKEVTEITKIDGVKLNLGPNEFVMYRLSGTEPTVRILVESPTKEQSEEYVKVCKEFLHELGVI